MVPSDQIPEMWVIKSLKIIIWGWRTSRRQKNYVTILVLSISCDDLCFHPKTEESTKGGAIFLIVMIERQASFSYLWPANCSSLKYLFKNRWSRTWISMIEKKIILFIVAPKWNKKFIIINHQRKKLHSNTLALRSPPLGDLWNGTEADGLQSSTYGIVVKTGDFAQNHKTGLRVCGPHHPA